jgi:ElaA protein
VVTIHVAAFDELDAATLYALLRLRVDVFVVEQRCAYPELDGRDIEPETRHVWLEEAGVPSAYLRMLAEPDGGARIGRVCVAGSARGRGLARRLMEEALAVVGDRPCILHAQSYLVGFYRGLGFVATGPEYLDEDGIPHVPMRRGPAEPGPMRRGPAEPGPMRRGPAEPGPMRRDPGASGQ